MGLMEEIESMKKQIANAEKEPEENEDSGEQMEEASEEFTEETQEAKDPVEEKAEEKPEEKVEAKEAAKEPEEKLDNAGYARLRREAAAAKKRAEDAELALLELRKSSTEKSEEQAETPAIELPPELKEAAEDVRYKHAAREFTRLESEFKSRAADYEGVAAEYSAALMQSIRINNPRMTSEELMEETRKTVLKKAANFAAQGFQPAEELYHEAKELGFTGENFRKMTAKEEKTEVKEVEEDIRPDMKKVAENRKRSSGMTGASGKSEGQMTRQAAADLSVADWAKLPAAEKKRLLYG